MSIPEDRYNQICEGVKLILQGVGEDTTTPHFARTPQRVAAMYKRILDGKYTTLKPSDITTFPNDGQYHGIVAVHHVPFYSFCAHHTLPFFGHFALGYMPKDKILGLSKLIRIFRHGCKRFTTQEDITQLAVNTLQEVLGDTPGVICHVCAAHTCMSMRGVQTHGALTTTCAYNGIFESDVAARNAFVAEATRKALT